MAILFVLEKDKKFRVFDSDLISSSKVKELMLEGWKHIHTIDPCIFLGNLSKKNPNIFDL